MPTTHTVESTPETVRSGFLDPAAKPVATVTPGDTVRYPNTWTHWGNEAVYGIRRRADDGGIHPRHQAGDGPVPGRRRRRARR